MDFLLTPLAYDYMRKAIFISALIGGVCAFLSCFVILKGWSLMGDALSHSVVPGVAIAYLAGWPFALGAFATGLLAALGMGLVKGHSRIREDAVIGVVFTAFFAAGLLLISLYPSQIDLRTIIFGNILAIADDDIWQVFIISAVCLLVLGLRWKDLVLFVSIPTTLDPLGCQPSNCTSSSCPFYRRQPWLLCKQWELASSSPCSSRRVPPPFS